MKFLSLKRKCENQAGGLRNIRSHEPKSKYLKGKMNTFKFTSVLYGSGAFHARFRDRLNPFLKLGPMYSEVNSHKIL